MVLISVIWGCGDFMTVNEFYIKVKGDYAEVSSRLMNDDIIKRFLLKFENDKSFETLKQAIIENNAEKAFMAAHTLKGVTISLGLGELNVVAAEITELLRGATEASTQEVKTSFSEVKKYYEKAILLLKEID